MKQIVYLIAWLIMATPKTNGKTFASINVPKQNDGLMQYSTYNFMHLTNVDLSQNQGWNNNRNEKPGFGRILGDSMILVGLGGIGVGTIGMSNIEGGDDINIFNSPEYQPIRLEVL